MKHSTRIQFGSKTVARVFDVSLDRRKLLIHLLAEQSVLLKVFRPVLWDVDKTMFLHLLVNGATQVPQCGSHHIVAWILLPVLSWFFQVIRNLLKPRLAFLQLHLANTDAQRFEFLENTLCSLFVKQIGGGLRVKSNVYSSTEET